MMFLVTVMNTSSICWGEDEKVVGQRPYEMVWVNRTQDDNPPLIDFEDLTGWRVETDDAIATFERSQEQQIWDKYVVAANGSRSPVPED